MDGYRWFYIVDEARRNGNGHRGVSRDVLGSGAGLELKSGPS